MAKSPSPETSFKLYGMEGFQHIHDGHTKIKMLFAITDARDQFAAWYVFAERALPLQDKIFDRDTFEGIPGTIKQFGAGNIGFSPLVTRRPRRVDAFAEGVARGKARTMTTARIVNAEIFETSDKPHVMWIEVRMSIDVITGTEMDVAYATLRMSCLERPNGNIFPALGFLDFLEVEPFASFQHRSAFRTERFRGIRSPS